MFTIFSIYWGALWKIPDHKLPGWVVDVDGNTIGSTVANALLSDTAATSKVSWKQMPTSDFLGPDEVGHWIVEQKAWVAVIIHANATSTLTSAASTIDLSYKDTQALTVYVVEARNENA